MKKLFIDRLGFTALGLLVRLALVVIAAELFIMLLIDEWLKPLYGGIVPSHFWQVLDPFALVIIEVPVLYFLVFRPMRSLLLEREQRAIDLHQAAIKVIEEDEKLIEQHRIALENRERMIQIEKLSSMGTMVGGVAHEINNPLMGVMNYVEYARDKSTDTAAKQVLDNALHEIHRIKKIVSNMLVFIRTESKQQESCDALAVVNRTVDLLEGEFTKSRVKVDIQIAEGLPLVKCNASSLQQVLVNLMLNARDAIADQTDQQITIIGRQETGKIVLLVCDNGPGIPEQIRDKIFDPFFTTKPVGKGTGLGLSVSQHLVQEVGGSIIPHQEHGFATCFRLVFVPALKEGLKI
jgi:C4-dicarboxylate-specific signal transduction histidine kinase